MRLVERHQNDESRAAAIKALREAQTFNVDRETAHSMADDALCEFVRALGYGDVVDEWDKVDKWYA